MTGALQQLLDSAAAAVPGLRGRVVAAAGLPPWHATPGLQAVHHQLRLRHPEAGPHYAALRGWGLLVWQPVYMAVLAAHLHGALLDLDRLAIELSEGEVGGCLLAEHQPARCDEHRCPRSAAAQLAAGIARLLPAWQAHAPVHAKAALRTCADCALAALMAVQRRTREPLSRTRELGLQWLQALGLEGESGYFSYAGPGGAEALALQRRVCCLHFRRRDGDLCSTCPKRPLHDRVACLRAESGFRCPSMDAAQQEAPSPRRPAAEAAAP